MGGAGSAVMKVVPQHYNRALVEMKDRFQKAGVQIAPMNTQQFSDLYFSDIARWKVVIEKAKIKLD